MNSSKFGFKTYQQLFVSQLVWVKLVVKAQKDAETGVFVEKDKTLISPASENWRALLTLSPEVVYPGVWGSPVIGLYVPHLVLARIQDVTFVKNRTLSASSVMLTPVLASLVHCVI